MQSISGPQHGAVQNHSTVNVQFLVKGNWSAPHLFIADKVVPADTVRVSFVTESRPTKLKFTNSNVDGWGFKALAVNRGQVRDRSQVTDRDSCAPDQSRWSTRWLGETQ